MDTLVQIGMDWIVAMQSLGGWLEIPMRFFTFLGSENFFNRILALVPGRAFHTRWNRRLAARYHGTVAVHPLFGSGRGMVQEQIVYRANLDRFCRLRDPDRIGLGERAVSGWLYLPC